MTSRQQRQSPPAARGFLRTDRSSVVAEGTTVRGTERTGARLHSQEFEISIGNLRCISGDPIDLS